MLSGIKSKGDRKIILEKEEKIRKQIGVERFTDYGDSKDKLRNELKKYFTEYKANKYAKQITTKSDKYKELLPLFGIDIR